MMGVRGPPRLIQCCPPYVIRGAIRQAGIRPGRVRWKFGSDGRRFGRSASGGRRRPNRVEAGKRPGVDFTEGWPRLANGMPITGRGRAGDHPDYTNRSAAAVQCSGGLFRPPFGRRRANLRPQVRVRQLN